MNRLSALLAVVGLLVTLCACQSSSNQNGTTVTTTAAAEPLATTSSSSGTSAILTSFSSTTSSSRRTVTTKGTEGTVDILSYEDYFDPHIYTDPQTATPLHYLFHEPARKLDRSAPLAIYLHCLNDVVTEQRMGTATQFVDSMMFMEIRSEEYSAYTLVPMTPREGEGWWTTDQINALIKLIGELKATYNIDPKRVYITGISMGGFTTCQLLDLMPADTFAAAIPLSGCGNVNNPYALRNTAFRIYHAVNDNTVHVSCARQLNQQLLASGHPKTEYFEIEVGTHLSPLHNAYIENRNEFFSWLFAQHLP